MHTTTSFWLILVSRFPRENKSLPWAVLAAQPDATFILKFTALATLWLNTLIQAAKKSFSLTLKFIASAIFFSVTISLPSRSARVLDNFFIL